LQASKWTVFAHAGAAKTSELTIFVLLVSLIFSHQRDLRPLHL
jgi:hypothetical protein